MMFKRGESVRKSRSKYSLDVVVQRRRPLLRSVMTRYEIKQHGKVVETHHTIRQAEVAFWTLTAHELKSGRVANLSLDNFSSHPLTGPDKLPELASWAQAVLKEHELW